MILLSLKRDNGGKSWHSEKIIWTSNFLLFYSTYGLFWFKCIVFLLGNLGIRILAWLDNYFKLFYLFNYFNISFFSIFNILWKLFITALMVIFSFSSLHFSTFFYIYFFLHFFSTFFKLVCVHFSYLIFPQLLYDVSVLLFNCFMLFNCCYLKAYIT